ncbi:MAG: hypothetical protein CL943_00905 [Candidatus Diapherotrites archaeon]|uniref:KaiC domain-containing protein n=1 Tax=Candidatus Iainarchaeum sp. TaxID=3101447 RepID=A0A2D6M0A1_9ARCH|nr:hypothetical protein [Candidatus Diapherotrites archaeon]|tara:strand:- start:2899 stop:4086 length:1188 start_codon:yes stop_codon:yes gene_type:complete
MTSSIIDRAKGSIPKSNSIEVLPTRVSSFDKLIVDHGLERGSTTLISGGAGTGKTTFCLQSLYHGAMNGEKGVFISFEENINKIKHHMLKNYGWDFDKLEKEGKLAMVKMDPAKIARMVEGTLAKRVGTLRIQPKQMKLPLKPDRICVDSLSALSIAFADERSYRKYVRELFEFLEGYNSVNLVIGETEQNPDVYSRTGVEEFLADGVIVFYNTKDFGRRKRALEILKLRSSNHVENTINYKLGSDGMQLLLKEEWEQGRLLGTKPLDSMTGRAKAGLKEGAYYISQKGYQTQFVEKLGFKAYPGTLNLTVEEDVLADFLSKIKKIKIKGFDANNRTFGNLVAYNVLVEGKEKAALIFPERSTHGRDEIEVIAAISLRDKFKLKDGRKVKLSKIK